MAMTVVFSLSPVTEHGPLYLDLLRGLEKLGF